MDFQPLDYLTDLNLDLSSPLVGDANGTSPNNGGATAADLAMFSHSDFFDFDVLGQDNIVPIKPSVAQNNTSLQFGAETESYNIPQYQQQIASVEDNTTYNQQQVKREPQEESFLMPTGNNVADYSATPTAAATPSESNYSAIQAANEDKRKRNTAASARFRIKKKMKEQQMEQRTKELQDRVQQLEKKLRTLEMENRCLKSLVAQKSEKKSSDLVESIKQRSLQTTSEPVFQFT